MEVKCKVMQNDSNGNSYNSYIQHTKYYYYYCTFPTGVSMLIGANPTHLGDYLSQNILRIF